MDVAVYRTIARPQQRPPPIGEGAIVCSPIAARTHTRRGIGQAQAPCMVGRCDLIERIAPTGAGVVHIERLRYDERIDREGAGVV